VIKHVMSGMNPQGCQVRSFKRPPPKSWITIIYGAATRPFPKEEISDFQPFYYKGACYESASSNSGISKTSGIKNFKTNESGIEI